MKRPPIKGQRHGWTVVDADGRLCLGSWCYATKAEALSDLSEGDKGVVRVEAVGPVRKARRGRR